MAMTVFPAMASSMPAWMCASDSLSRADVASSRISSGASFSRARAMAMRCRWPPESLTPRSPTRVS